MSLSLSLYLSFFIRRRRPSWGYPWTLLRLDLGKWRPVQGKRKRHGVTKLLWARPIYIILLGAFIPWVIHTARWKMQSQLNIPSVITFIDIRFLPAKVLFSVHHLLFQRPVDIPWPPFDKGWSARTPEQWFFLKVFLLKFLACVTLKVQSYILMEQRFSRLQQRNNLLTQSLTLLMLRLLLASSTFWLYALPGTQWIRDVRTWQQALHRLNNVARVWIKLPCKLEC